MRSVNRLRLLLGRRPLVTAVVYTGAGVLPLFLVSAQILQLGRELDFGVSRLGIGTAAFFAASALAANRAGRVMTSLGPARGLGLGSALTVVSCIVAGAATTWWMIPTAMAIGGAANGTIQVAANLTIFDGVKAGRQGLAFGSKQASVPMASVLAGLSLPAVGYVFGWRWVFAGAAVLALILSFSVPRLVSNGKAKVEELMTGRLPRSLMLLAVAGIFGAAAGNGISLFVVPSAVDVGMDEPLAGVVLAVFSVLVVGIRIGAGWIVDRRRSSGHLEMAWLVGAGAVGALLLTSVASPGWYLVAMPWAVLGAWGWPGIIFFTVVHSYPAFPGRATGLVLSGNLMGTMTGPLVVGWLAGRGSYSAAWLFVAVSASVAAIGFSLSGRVGRRAAPVSP